jgi:3-hydroxyacyl-[acyl-carrier-protein] dehydratase
MFHLLQKSCLEYSMTTRENEQLTVKAVFSFAEDFIGFAGHFPDMPVLPAIVQLASVRCLVELILKRRVQPVSYKRTKFRGIVQPNEKVIVELQMNKKAVSWEVDFNMRKMTGDAVADGSCVFAAESRG